MFCAMSGLHILVASADASRAAILAQALRAAGHLVEVRADPDSAAMLRPEVDGVLLDLRAPTLEAQVLADAVMRATATPPEPLEAVERRHIALALQHTGGNKRRAAHLLGIARSTLIQKVRRYQIPASRTE
jgi:DNA-binding NtrC family response regulator